MSQENLINHINAVFDQETLIQIWSNRWCVTAAKLPDFGNVSVLYVKEKVNHFDLPYIFDIIYDDCALFSWLYPMTLTYNYNV